MVDDRNRAVDSPLLITRVMLGAPSVPRFVVRVTTVPSLTAQVREYRAMGSSIDWVVDIDARESEAPELAARVIAHLVGRGIILPAFGHLLAENGQPLYSPGPKADIVRHPGGFAVPVGMEVVTERRVFHAGDDGLDALSCPNCGQRHAIQNLPWSDAVQAWWSRSGDAGLSCPACQQSTAVTEWNFDPEWALGHLGFGFHNWRLTAALAGRIVAVLGHRCRLVFERS
jgi:hypothetical protein